MKIKPVKEGKRPKYPTMEFFAKNPELLSGNVPERWIGNRLVATSLATFVLLGSPKSAGTRCAPAIEIPDRISNKTDHQDSEAMQDSIKIAPIFVHGDGSGATGCIVISPPVFISEEEARIIIFDAFRDEGIILGTDNCPVLSIEGPPIANYGMGSEGLPDVKVELQMDGYNEELNLAVQFVSANDFKKFHSDEGGVGSSVDEYKTKKAAGIIWEELKEKSRTHCGIFYDPLPSSKVSRNSYKKLHREAEKLLLAQVKDFINWIRQEKITLK